MGQKTLRGMKKVLVTSATYFSPKVSNDFPFQSNLKSGLCSYLVISVYFSSLPVAHLSDAPRRGLVVTGDSARIQDETTENSAWFFNMLGI